MRTKLVTITLALISINAFTQITVTDNDIIDVGDNIYEALDSVSGSAIQIGSSGANQTWDFSSLQENVVNIIEHVDPSSTQFGSMHPSSNLCTLDDGQYIYMNKSSTGLDIVGFDDQQLFNPILALPLPLTYPMQYSTGPILAINDKEENNAFIPDSLATVMTFGAAHTIDSINIQLTLESSYEIDGWGNVILPMGTFSALRLYVSTTNTQEIFLYCTDTLFGASSGWYPAPQQLFPTNTETEYFYQWWSNDPATKMGVVHIDVDEFGNSNSTYIQFLTIPQANLVSNLESIKVNVYPNPTSKDLIITTDLINCSYNLTDLKGSKLLFNEFNNSTIIDLSSFSSGTYFLQIYTGEGDIVTKKIVVE